MAAPLDLTSFFVPPAPCTALTSFGDRQRTLYQAAGASCLPSGFDDEVYYSPGICPSGYATNTIGTAALMTPLADGESIYACCPSGFSVATNGYADNGGLKYGCLSSITSKATIISMASSRASAQVTTTVDPQSFILVSADAIKIRYQSSDSSVLSSARSAAAARPSSTLAPSTTLTTSTSSQSPTTTRVTSSPTQTPQSAAPSHISKNSIIAISSVSAVLVALFLVGLLLKCLPIMRPSWLLAFLRGKGRGKDEHPNGKEPELASLAPIPFVNHSRNLQDPRPVYSPVSPPSSNTSRAISAHRPSSSLPDVFVIPPIDHGPALSIPGREPSIRRKPAPLPASSSALPQPAVAPTATADPEVSPIFPPTNPFSDRYQSVAKQQRASRYGAIPEETEDDRHSEVSAIFEEPMPGPNATDEERMRSLDRIERAQSVVKNKRESTVSPL